MHAAFVLQFAVHLIAADQRDDFLQTAHGAFAFGSDFDFPVLRFGVAGVHAENFRGEERGFVAAGAGADFEHDVLFIDRIFRQQQDFQIGFHLRDGRLDARDFVLRHLLQFGIGLGQHGFGLREIVIQALPFAVLADDFFKIAARFGGFAVLIAIADDGGIGKLPRQLIETFFGFGEPFGKLHGD